MGVRRMADTVNGRGSVARMVLWSALVSLATFIAGISVLAPLCYLLTRGFADRYGTRPIEYAIVISLSFGVLISALYLYGPLPSLIPGQEPTSMRPERSALFWVVLWVTRSRPESA